MQWFVQSLGKIQVMLSKQLSTHLTYLKGEELNTRSQKINEKVSVQRNRKINLELVEIARALSFIFSANHV